MEMAARGSGGAKVEEAPVSHCVMAVMRSVDRAALSN
jgi:hypothetical protein